MGTQAESLEAMRGDRVTERQRERETDLESKSAGEYFTFLHS